MIGFQAALRVAAPAAAALAAASAVAAQVSARPVQAPPATGLLAGTVVEVRAGHAVDGVRLRLFGDGLGGNHTTISDDDGRFVLRDLPAGRFTLTASKAGYVDVIFGQREPGHGRPGTAIELAAGQQVNDLTVEIPTGGVITGTVSDEEGRPAVGTPVRASRWSVQTGERRLVATEKAATDDRGIYRISGLAPGRYIVSAIPRSAAVATPEVVNARQTRRPATVTPGQFSYRVSETPFTTTAEGGESQGTGYAPVYYPGTLRLETATEVDVGVSEQRRAIDLQLERIPLSRVEGSVMIPPNVRMSNVRVRLINTTVQAPGVSVPSARAGRDGRFVFNGVAPGRYLAAAAYSVRNPPAQAIGALLDGQPPLPPGNTSVRFWAVADVNVYGQEVPPVTLVLQPGTAVSGQVIFDGPSPPDDQRRVRLSLSPVGQFVSPTGATSASTNLEPGGRFRFLGVVPGTYRIRASSGAGGWWAKSAVVGGRDTLDFPFEVPAHENVSGLTFTLTRNPASLTATIIDAMSRPSTDYLVVLFPEDSGYWLPQARRVKATRPSTDGRVVFTDLPAGRYRLAAVTPTEPGVWYDPQFLHQLMTASVAISLGEGESQTQMLRVGG